MRCALTPEQFRTLGCTQAAASRHVQLSMPGAPFNSKQIIQVQWLLELSAWRARAIERGTKVWTKIGDFASYFIYKLHWPTDAQISAFV